jgi:MerR family transcriptional regulator/heat shock protein HspR
VTLLIVDLFADDPELLEELVAAGIVRRDDDGDLEVARVARTLVRELDVNVPGVEIIVRLRRELIETQRQVAELIRMLKSRAR